MFDDLRLLVLLVAGSLLPAVPALPRDWIVELPNPYRVDDRVVSFKDFRGTRVRWGQCTDGNELLEVERETMACSWCARAVLDIPDGRVVCIDAQMIGLDGSVMARSYPVRVSTVGPTIRPMQPIRLFAE